MEEVWGKACGLATGVEGGGKWTGKALLPGSIEIEWKGLYPLVRWDFFSRGNGGTVDAIIERRYYGILCSFLFTKK